MNLQIKIYFKNLIYAFVINLLKNIGVVQKDQRQLRQVMRANKYYLFTS